jgi:hypothetical protein
VVSGAVARAQARTAGWLYLVVIGAGIFAEFYSRASLTVRGDPAATAHNLLTHMAVYRAGLVADIAGTAAYVAITALLYLLFRPVSRTVSLTAACFSLVGCAGMCADMFAHIVPMLLLGGAPYLNAMPAPELQALVLTSLRLHSYGYLVIMVFFGCYCALLGYLVFRSGFLPRLIGILLLFAGVCDVSKSFSVILDLPIPDALGAVYSLAALIGEGSLALWLAAVGVNASAWQSRAPLALGAAATNM